MKIFLSRKFPEYKIHLYLDEFGSEDLLCALANQHKLKVYLNTLRYFLFSKLDIQEPFNIRHAEANIIIVSDSNDEIDSIEEIMK